MGKKIQVKDIIKASGISNLFYNRPDQFRFDGYCDPEIKKMVKKLEDFTEVWIAEAEKLKEKLKEKKIEEIQNR